MNRAFIPGNHAESRNDLRRDFARRQGWPDAQESFLAGDASPRRYYRLSRGQDRAVIMDAAPPQDIEPFIQIDELLRHHDFSAPKILARDPRGFLLLEDFGDDTFTRCLARGGEEWPLYRLATDTAIALARQIPSNQLSALPAFDTARALHEVGLLLEWYWPLMFDRPAPQSDFIAGWEKLLPMLDAVPQAIVLFDFHVDNLMRLTDRAGVAACGLLDFQDAVRGPMMFDLVSLLTDVRRDIDADLAAAMLDRFFDAVAPSVLDRDHFDAACALIAAQRLTRILGTFIRLWRRDDKPHYLRFLPRVWRLLEAALVHPDLQPVRNWFDREWPADHRTVPAAALRQEPQTRKL